MLRELKALNADTGTLEHFELHKINLKKKYGNIESVDLFQGGELVTYYKTGDAIFESDNKHISIPAHQLEV